MKKYNPYKIRIILSILLLWQVWTHAHWSVSLCLTLIFIGLETFIYIVGKNLL
jgi:hypothetical protein